MEHQLFYYSSGNDEKFSALASEQPFKEDPQVSHTSSTEPIELQKIGREVIYKSTAYLAILLQLCHPNIAQGLADHSNFSHRAMNRLKGTEIYLNAIIYGTNEEKSHITSIINRTHSRIKGDGYSAHDSELQKWVAATLFYSIFTAHETFFGKLSTDRLERIYQESSVFATSLRMPVSMWPDTVADFWEYWNEKIENMPITHQAMIVAHDVLYPKEVPLWIHGSLPIIRLWTTYWLPERQRLVFGLRDTMMRRSICWMSLSATSMIYPLMPRYLRQFWHEYYMSKLRQLMSRRR